MNKTSRINTMMRYINNRQFFTIRELTEAFNISRSTAIRDLREISELGMPLTAQAGREGGYSVLHNQLLPAVQFNQEELKAIFVSFMASTNNQLPYLQNRKSLTEKLLAIASQSQQDELLALQDLLPFSNLTANHETILELTDFAPTMLVTLLNATLVSRQQLLNRKSQMQPIDCFIDHFFIQADQWQVLVLNLGNEQPLTIPINQITRVTVPSNLNANLTVQHVHALIKQHEPQPNVQVTLGPHAVVKYKRLSDQTGHINYLDPFQQSATLTTFVALTDPSAIQGFCEWLLYLGTDAIPTRLPAILKSALRTQLTKFQQNVH